MPEQPRDTKLPIDCLFDHLAEGDNIDAISERYHVKRGAISSMLHGIAHLLRAPPSSQRENIDRQIDHENADLARFRQEEIERLRAQHHEEFERIEEQMPGVDELLSITIKPPREWFDERW